MKLVANEHVVCSAIVLALRYKTLASEKENSQDSNREDSGRAGLRAEQGEWEPIYETGI